MSVFGQCPDGIATTHSHYLISRVCTDVYLSLSCPSDATDAAVAAVTHEIGKMLDCGLTQEQTKLLLQLLKNGEHPEALAKAVKTIRDPRDKSAWDE